MFRHGQPFATMKYRIFGHPRLLMRGSFGARVEIGLATMAYTLKRITNVAEIHAISMRRLSKIEAADDPSDGADDE